MYDGYIFSPVLTHSFFFRDVVFLFIVSFVFSSVRLFVRLFVCFCLLLFSFFTQATDEEPVPLCPLLWPIARQVRTTPSHQPWFSNIIKCDFFHVRLRPQWFCRKSALQAPFISKIGYISFCYRKLDIYRFVFDTTSNASFEVDRNGAKCIETKRNGTKRNETAGPVDQWAGSSRTGHGNQQGVELAGLFIVLGTRR